MFHWHTLRSIGIAELYAFAKQTDWEGNKEGNIVYVGKMLSELGGCLPKFYYFCTAYRLIDERQWGLWKNQA